MVRFIPRFHRRGFADDNLPRSPDCPILQRFHLLSTIGRSMIAWALAGMAAAQPITTQGAETNEFEVVAYSKLTGFLRLGDAYKRRHAENLMRSAAICVELNRRVGKAVTSSAGFDPTPRASEIEHFIAIDRAVVVQRSEWPVLGEDCALTWAASNKMSIHRANGRCEVDLVKRTAYGFCDSAAPPLPAHRILPLKPVAVRTIAGVPCQVYVSELARTELCIAQPEGFERWFYSNNVSLMPGLTVEIRTTDTGEAMTAEVVEISRRVKRSVLDIPSGVSVLRGTRR